MSRALVVSNILLALMAAALAWALYALVDDRRKIIDQIAANDAEDMALSVSGIDAGTADRLATQLARIDARLAALEGSAATSNASSATFERPVISDAEADRRLRSIIKSNAMNGDDLALFHAELAALPEEERFVLSTALARAVNENRIRLRL